MSVSPELHRNRARAQSFGSVAAEYDRVRPTYPDALIVELLGRGPRDALDVGCGTGKAARLLAARGLPVLGVEIDPAMAEVARAHGIEVEVGAFETWDNAGRRFDLLTCGQAWHWVDPARGAAKAREVVRPGGTVALFWNRVSHADDVHEALQQVYERISPDLADQPDRRLARDRSAATDGLAAAGFIDLTEREFTWQRDYSRAEWLALLSTFSDHHLLPADQWRQLSAGVSEVVDARGGTITASYRTVCILVRAPGERA
ncbi:class I SAM-dependent methyltransferase [uncultured Jatrophihabitans sp.]|uniref:class I SAM-dependent methyltransferase n=1 Tax=uncultured Jatrophihabitans sp. TaxID=1610747 RepID=UPI0035CBD995